VFAALVTSTVITLAIAPQLDSRVLYSVRDAFEFARLAEYWLLYRLALTVVQGPRSGRLIVYVLGAGAVLSAAFGLAQYLGGQSFNESVTEIWAPGHSIQGIVHNGRAVGTIGNANMYGIFSGLFLVVALALLILRERAEPGERWLLAAIVLAGTLGVVLSQSRTATFALIGAMGLAFLVVVAWRRKRAAYGIALGSFICSAVFSVAFVELVPPEFSTYHDRFSPTGLQNDTSLSLRLDKWKSVFAGFFSEDPDFCTGARPGDIAPAPSRTAPDGAIGVPPADAAALARDEQRKADVKTLSGAMLDYYCKHSTWPIDVPLDEAFVPDILPELPVDPATGEHYLADATGGGYRVGAQLENPADPMGPIYTLGSLASVITNSSFDGGGNSPSSWRTDATASASRTRAAALFGDWGARLTFDDGGGFYQHIIYPFPRGTAHTFSTWIRQSEPAGEDRAMELYIIATMPGGEVADPFASQTFTVPGDGRWVRVTLPFETPTDRTITILQPMIRVDWGSPPVSFDVDGITLSEGAFPPSYPNVGEIDPSTLRSRDLPDFADSPLIGVGPLRNETVEALDNEYALFLDRWGIVGTLAYLAMWGAVLWTLWRTWLRREGAIAALALGMVTFTVALMVFNVAAGSFYSFQLMAIFWLLIGFLAVRRGHPEGERHHDTA
jgi:hypothetical protein